MMKTKLTLFVTVLAAALFGMGCASLDDGLIAHYPFSGDAKDATGNGHDGVVNGATLGVSRYGTAGTAYNFDGDDHIVVPNKNDLSGFNSMTISVWFKKGERASGLESLVTKWFHNKSIDTYGLWVMGNGSVEAGTNNKMDLNAGNVNGGYDLKRWQHFVFTHDFKKGGGMYKDGKLISESSIKGGIRSSDIPLYIGADNDEGKLHRHFKGSIDDVRIYNRALSAEEVKALYDLEKPKGK